MKKTNKKVNPERQRVRHTKEFKLEAVRLLFHKTRIPERHALVRRLANARENRLFDLPAK